jgi:hypothetical protein
MTNGKLHLGVHSCVNKASNIIWGREGGREGGEGEGNTIEGFFNGYTCKHNMWTSYFTCTSTDHSYNIQEHPEED